MADQVAVCHAMYATTCTDMTCMRHLQDQQAQWEGRLAGWQRGRAVGRQGTAGREEGPEEGKLVQCQEGCALPHAIALHVMPYIPYIQPLDAQFGVGVKKFGSWPQNLAERRADKI